MGLLCTIKNTVTIMKEQTTLTILDTGSHFEKVKLVPTTDHHYLLLIAEVDTPTLPFFISESTKKKTLIATCKKQAQDLKHTTGIIDTAVLKARLIPPGRGAHLKQRPDVHIAKFDVAVLIEVDTKHNLEEVCSSIQVTQIIKAMKEAGKYTQIIKATNIRKIGAVDHSRDGVFLFNYFYADDQQQNLGIWEYTAGWFQQETDLHNSTVLLPAADSNTQYTIINHCRWNSMWDILPDLLFKRSFRTYVLDNFKANNVAAIPILYRLA